jgi:hypothetical protein
VISLPSNIHTLGSMSTTWWRSTISHIREHMMNHTVYHMMSVYNITHKGACLPHDDGIITSSMSTSISLKNIDKNSPLVLHWASESRQGFPINERFRMVMWLMWWSSCHSNSLHPKHTDPRTGNRDRPHRLLSYITYEQVNAKDLYHCSLTLFPDTSKFQSCRQQSRFWISLMTLPLKIKVWSPWQIDSCSMITTQQN